MPFNIAIIKLNNLQINSNNLSLEQIKNDINDYVTIQTVNTLDEMLETVVTVTKLSPQMICDTDNCYDNEKHIFQLCHVDRETNKLEKKNDEKNILSSYLVQETKEIYGECVLMKSLITDDNTCAPSSINMDEIINIIYKKFIHTGIKLSQTGEVEEYIFSENPLQYLQDSGENVDNYKWAEIPFLKFSLLIIFKTNCPETNINKLATRLVGAYNVFGDVIITSKVNKQIYGDLDKDIFDKIIETSKGTLDDRELRENEIDPKVEDQELPIVRTKYIVLNDRYNKATENDKELCSGCNKYFDKVNMCLGCYRIGYHDKNCQKSHWTSHKKDCSSGKKSLNAIALQENTQDDN